MPSSPHNPEIQKANVATCVTILANIAYDCGYYAGKLEEMDNEEEFDRLSELLRIKTAQKIRLEELIQDLVSSI